MNRRGCLSLVLLWIAGNVHAAGDAWESAAHIRAVASEYVAAQVSAGAVVTAAPLDERLRLPACEVPLQALPPAGNPTRGAASIGVRCGGQAAWTIYVPVRVSEHLQVVMLKRPLSRGDAITADVIEMREQDSNALPYGYFAAAQDVIGKILKRPVAPGVAVSPDSLESPHAIKRGQLVTLLGKSGLIEVRAEGKALADAADGERVRVENANSRRIVEGVARSSGIVEVNL